MARADLNLLGALVVFGVLDYEQAKLLEATYTQREYIPALDLDSAIEVAVHTFNDIIEAQDEEDQPQLVAPNAGHAHETGTLDRYEPPQWWLVAHESWHPMVSSFDDEPPENDCAD